MLHDAASSSSPLERDLYCLSCGYSQRGIVADRCPECGRVYAELPPSPMRIPWSHRRYLGWPRAYWDTAIMVLFRRRELCAEMQHAVSYRDARRFWLLTIAWVYLPFLISNAVIYVAAGPQGREQTILFTALYAPLWPAVAINIGLLLFIAAATGLPSYFCHPRRLPLEQQNRAIALSYYTAAPLAAMPAAMALLIVSGLIERAFPDRGAWLGLLGVLLGLVVLGTWYIKTVAIVHAIADRSRMTLAVALPLLGLAVGVWLLMVTPLLLHCSALLIYSML